MPTIAEIQNVGVTSLKGIAGALNALGVKTRRGGKFYAMNVKDLLARVA